MRSLEEGRLLPQRMSQGMNLLSPCHPRFSAYCRDIRKWVTTTPLIRPFWEASGGIPNSYGTTLLLYARSCPASLRHMLPCSEEASSMSVKFSNLLGTGQIGQHLQERMELEVLKIGMSGCQGLEALLTPRVLPLAARIYDAGQIHMKVSGRKVAMDLIVQQKLVLLRDFIKINGALPEEYWSYTVAVVSAVAARGLNLADLGQSNLACEATSGLWPKLRFLDLGSWYENKEGEPQVWPSRDSQLWSFMSGHIEATKVATLKSIAHGFKSIEEVRSSVRSVLSPAFQQALKEDGAWL